MESRQSGCQLCMAHAGAYTDLGAGQHLEDPLLPRTQAPFVLWDRILPWHRWQSCTGGRAAWQGQSNGFPAWTF